jgi:3-oxoadipate enol-lactonase
MTIVWIDRMAVDSRGEGDAIVFVHGLGGSMNFWTPLLPGLGRYRSVRMELPGAGRSHKAYAMADSSPDRGKLSIASQAQAVVRVCEALGLQRVHLAGHSLGTLIAQHVAVNAPMLVRSLSLFGVLADPPQAMRENMKQRAAVAREQGMFDIAEGIALSPSTRETQPVTVAYVRDSIAAQNAEGFARNCIALAEAEAARAELIHCPVLMVNGDEDMVTPLSGARALAAKLANARVEVLTRCGHWPTLERPAECQRLLREFLDRLR